MSNDTRPSAVLKRHGFRPDGNRLKPRTYTFFGGYTHIADEDGDSNSREGNVHPANLGFNHYTRVSPETLFPGTE